jgi:hypothetical protein
LEQRPGGIAARAGKVIKRIYFLPWHSLFLLRIAAAYLESVEDARPEVGYILKSGNGSGNGSGSGSSSLAIAILTCGARHLRDLHFNIIFSQKYFYKR